MSSMLSVLDVAERLSVTNVTVYKLINSGELGALRVGKSYRISEEQYERYIRNSSTVPVEDFQCEACKTYQMIVDNLKDKIAALEEQ